LWRVACGNTNPLAEAARTNRTEAAGYQARRDVKLAALRLRDAVAAFQGAVHTLELLMPTCPGSARRSR